jgi:tetratricopeptide (TPR) repeat protein
MIEPSLLAAAEASSNIDLAPASRQGATPELPEAPLADPAQCRALAQLSASAGDDDGALAALRRALALLGPSDAAQRAGIYVAIGGVRARRGEPEEALADYGRALLLVPRYVPALEAIVSLHAAAGDWSEVLAAEERLFLALPEQTRFERLVTAAARWEEIARVPTRARALLERALRIRPNDAAARGRLHDLSEGGCARALVSKVRSIVSAVARRYARAASAARRKGRAPVVIRVVQASPVDAIH